MPSRLRTFLHPRQDQERKFIADLVNQRIQQWMTALLILSLCLAGMVSISPALHVAIEHGGQGPAHTHRVGSLSLVHTHPHPHPHELPEATSSTEDQNLRQPPRFFASTHRDFSLPSISLSGFWSRLSRFLKEQTKQESDIPPPSPGDAPSDHVHHSLAQLMSSGLIDQAIDATPFRVYFLALHHLELPSPTDPALIRWLDSQTAGRAPPQAWS